jgi:serine/threonine protein kinase
MELVDGGSLADMINKKVSLPVERLLQIAEGIAVGLDHVHNCLTSDGIRGIIHRDLTPANVLLTRNDEVKVSDFGLANAVGNTLLTKTCDMLGTFPYISPEQFDSSHDVDKRTDIYSFGALMYHLSCGIPPFRGENWNDVSGKIKEQVPVAPAKLREDLPGAFSNMLMQCLEKKAEDRFQDFADIIALLNLHLQTNGVSEKVADSTCSLSRLLDAAEGEAASAGSALVEPTHLLLAVTTLEPAMLSCWFQETDLNGQDFADNLRRRIQGKHIEGNPQPLHYRRSTLRVVALARAFSEDDGGLHARHILQALLQELSIQEMMGQALHMVDAPNGAMARLLDIIKRKK